MAVDEGSVSGSTLTDKGKRKVHLELIVYQKKTESRVPDLGGAVGVAKEIARSERGGDRRGWKKGGAEPSMSNGQGA